MNFPACRAVSQVLEPEPSQAKQANETEKKAQAGRKQCLGSRSPAEVILSIYTMARHHSPKPQHYPRDQASSSAMYSEPNNKETARALLSRAYQVIYDHRKDHLGMRTHACAMACEFTHAQV